MMADGRTDMVSHMYTMYVDITCFEISTFEHPYTYVKVDRPTCLDCGKKNVVRGWLQNDVNVVEHVKFSD